MYSLLTINSSEDFPFVLASYERLSVDNTKENQII